MNSDNRHLSMRDADGCVIISGDGNTVHVYAHYSAKGAEKPPDPPDLGPNPYRSLSAFLESDAKYFFGRDVPVAKLLEKFSAFFQSSPSLPARFLAILGPSGSGKSSVARAGFIPTLATQSFPNISKFNSVVFRPGENPFEPLAYVLAHVATGDPSASRKAREYLDVMADTGTDGLRFIAAGLPGISQTPLVIVIDQFEEIFTLCKDPERRAGFIDNLICAAQAPAGHVSVVITLRSDFLTETQKHSGLSRLISANNEIIPAMNETELREAIAKPAEKAGKPLDDAVVSLLISQTREREGALPLLEFALTQIWDGMGKGRTPSEVLTEIGGVGGALAGKAREIYDALKGPEKNIAKRAFLKMVQLGEGTKDTRQRVPIIRMTAHSETPEQVREVLDRFARPEARLITLLNVSDGERRNGETAPDSDGCAEKEEEAVDKPPDQPPAMMAEITHEALFEHWKELAGWINDRRGDIRFEKDLARAAEEWDRDGRQRGALWWESPKRNNLEIYCEKYAGDITGIQLDFYQTSLKAHKDTVKKEARQKRRLYALVFLLAFLTLVVGGIAFYAFNTRNMALDALDRANQQKELALSSTSLMTHQVISALAEIPRTRPILNFVLVANAKLLDRIFALNPDTPDAARQKAVSISTMGDNWMILGNSTQAKQYYEEAVEIFKKLAEDDPANTQAQRDLSVSYNKLGDLHLRLGQTDDALAAYQQALEISKKLAEDDPANFEAQQDLMISYAKMGILTGQSGDMEKALDWIEHSLSIAEILAKKDPNNERIQSQLEAIKDLKRKMQRLEE